MLKSSKYNIYLEYKEKFYIFNQLSADLREVDRELYEILKHNSLVDVLLDEDILDDLKQSHIICDTECIEENLILCANKQYRFSNTTARITIMPTLECNFRCWYCYETHGSGYMSLKEVEAVIAFCKKLINHQNLKSFMLDWFGGEPLMYFKEVVYPISKAIKDYCESKNVRFINTITTNGFYVTSTIIEQLKEVSLKDYQITLDGSKKYHDNTRFQSDKSGSYDVIVNNIVHLCRNFDDVIVTLRINYTPANLHSIDSIADSFPEDVRKHIFVEPQLVWQYKENVNTISDVIVKKMKRFHDYGYRTRGNTLPTFCNWCYAENMNQYVINFDLKVYKCTARDFNNAATSVGEISLDGVFRPNNYYYRYFVSSFFENKKCMKCEVLPSCTGMCIQKKIENSLPACPKEAVEISVINRIKTVIDAEECV